MGRRDTVFDQLEKESASQYGMRMRAHFAKKADHNKSESLYGFIIVITGTLAVSGFVAFGNGVLLAKIIPVCLSLLATTASTWLHFRRPHQLWAIYRTAQRHIEHHQVRYRFEIEEYDRSKNKDRLLARNVAAIALAAHELWVPLIPSPEGLERLRSPEPSILPRPSSHEAEERAGEKDPAKV